MAAARILYLSFDLTAITNESLGLEMWNFGRR